MSTPKATEANRMLQAQAALRDLSAEYDALQAAKGPAHLTQEDWARIAASAGELQRRARSWQGGRGG